MDILHLGKYYYPERGGIESVTQSLAEGAQKHGHRVTVLCFSQDDSRVEEDINGVMVKRMKNFTSVASQPISFKYLMESFTLSRKADIVHVHVPNVLALVVVLCIGWRRNTILHWHSDVIGKGLLGRLIWPLEHFSAKLSKTIIATSRNYAEHSSVLHRFESKVSVVPIGIDLASSRVRNTPGNARFILAVGRLVKYKGFHILIHAFSSVTEKTENVELVIVGVGPEEQQLKHLTRHLGLENRVRFKGGVDEDTLTELYRTAYMFCLPSISRAEAFGVVLLEAMAAGLPIVSSEVNGSGMSWVNKHMSSGLLVSPGNPDKLAAALLELIEDEDLRNRLSEGATQRVIRLFDNEVAIRKCLDVYNQMNEKTN